MHEAVRDARAQSLRRAAAPAPAPASVPAPASSSAHDLHARTRVLVPGRRLVDELGLNIKHIVTTSCDADTFFHCQHFAELTYNFCTDPDRYCRFWQTPIVVRKHARTTRTHPHTAPFAPAPHAAAERRLNPASVLAAPRQSDGAAAALPSSLRHDLRGPPGRQQRAVVSRPAFLGAAPDASPSPPLPVSHIIGLTRPGHSQSLTALPCARLLVRRRTRYRWTWQSRRATGMPTSSARITTCS